MFWTIVTAIIAAYLILKFWQTLLSTLFLGVIALAVIWFSFGGWDYLLQFLT